MAMSTADTFIETYRLFVDEVGHGCYLLYIFNLQFAQKKKNQLVAHGFLYYIISIYFQVG